MEDLKASLIEGITSFDDVKKSLQEIFEESLIPQGIEIPKPELVFAINDIPLFTKKSISTLIGKAKSGKTTATAWVVAQVIKENLTVLWIDTEQGLYYGSRTQHWVLSIAGLHISEYLRFYDLKIHNPKLRIDITEFAIKDFSPDIVIIDGIRDLVFDINSPEEATFISGDLMRWADQYNCHILNILHQNKGNEHARGHLGSELINKSETVLEVKKDESGLTVCEPAFTRGEAFSAFAFDRDDKGLPVLIENFVGKISTKGGESNRRKVLPIEISKDEHISHLKRAFGAEARLTYAELQPAISAAFELYGMQMGVVKTKGFIAFYIQEKYLIKAEKTSNKTFYEIANV